VQSTGRAPSISTKLLSNFQEEAQNPPEIEGVTA